MAARTTIAPTVPHAIAFFCKCDGRRRAASAMTIALSPARTRSMRMMAARADHHGVEKISMQSSVKRLKSLGRSGRAQGHTSTEPDQVQVEGLARQEVSVSPG